MSDLTAYLERKAAILADRRRELDGKSGVAEISASSYVAGITGLRPVRMGEYTVATDSGPALAGHGLGPSSPEMLLGALASCLAHTYVLQAALHDVDLDHVEVTVRGTLDMADAINPENQKQIAIGNLSFEADVRSSASVDVLKQLDEDVERACAVLNTLRHAHAVKSRRGASTS